MQTIEFQNLSKRYGELAAVDSLSASVNAGRITGFLGPNGAGKSTALRCLLGLATPTAGNALIHGQPYSALANPLKQVGSVLDSQGFNPALTAMQNLKVICASASIDDSRADQVLALVDLSAAAHKRTKGFSLGMKQRLSLAAALLGDPDVLILDEPANGLDPVGIAWLREFLKDLAAAGKTILVSSHQLAELQHTVDDVIIINAGKLIAAGAAKNIMQGQSLEEAFLRLIGVSK